MTTDKIERVQLTHAYKAMTPLQKWETLVLNGLIGTDEPWIEDMRQSLRELEAERDALREAAQALIDDVRRRHPGEELRCEYMRGLDAALISIPGHEE